MKLKDPTTSERWDDHWRLHDSTEVPNSKIVIAESILEPVFEALRNGDDVRLLDAGCGNGVHVEAIERFLESNPESSVRFSGFAIDLSPEAVEAAQRRIRSGRWSVSVQDTRTLDPELTSFDFVLSVGIICLCEDPQRAIDELVRVTKPGGMVGIYTNATPSLIVRAGLGFARFVGNHFGRVTRRAIAFTTAPVIGMLRPGSGVSRADGGLESSREIASSNLASPITRFYEIEDIRSWIRNSGAEIVTENPDNPFTAWCRVARKSPE